MIQCFLFKVIKWAIKWIAKLIVMTRLMFFPLNCYFCNEQGYVLKQLCSWNQLIIFPSQWINDSHFIANWEIQFFVFIGIRMVSNDFLAGIPSGQIWNVSHYDQWMARSICYFLFQMEIDTYLFGHFSVYNNIVHMTTTLFACSNLYINIFNTL